MRVPPRLARADCQSGLPGPAAARAIIMETAVEQRDEVMHGQRERRVVTSGATNAERTNAERRRRESTGRVFSV